MPSGPTITVVLKRPSRSSTIALTDDGSLVVMTNPDDGSISIFKTADNNRVATVATGGEPASVVLAPDNATAYVSNRADATVVKITGINTLSPTVAGKVSVGAEPVGLALSPSGFKLYVAQFAQGGVAQIDTASMMVTGTIAAPQHPRALLVTNNGDLNDNDEFVLVPEFFGLPVAGKEAQDDGRTGLIRIYHVSDLSKDTPINFAPVDSGFPDPAKAGATVLTSPNQLTSISMVDTRVFVTSVSASAGGARLFNRNVFPVVYVADFGTRMPITGAAGTTNLARAVDDANPTPSATNPRFALGDLYDMAFVPNKNIAYAVSRGADAIQRVVWDATNGVKIGSTQNLQIDVLGDATIGQCQEPIGNVANEAATRLYVNCWVTKKMAVVDLMAQTLSATFQSGNPPQSADDQSAQRGKRFFFTGRGRWSNVGTNGAKGGEGWSSCGSCHPDGQSDNITWSFATGPRQTISMVGSFSHGAGQTGQKRRIFNFTGINDEMHDFEGNVRLVSGGLGVITNPVTTGDTSTCNSGSLVGETPVGINPNAGFPGLGAPMKALTDGSGCAHKDWDDVDNFVSKLRPPRGNAADPAVIAKGADLFAQGGCNKCHGGQGWTISRRFYIPTANPTTNPPTPPVNPPESLALATATFKPTVFPTTWTYDTLQIESQPTIAVDTTGPGENTAIVPLWVACVLRNVGTFGSGIGGDANLTATLELNQKGARAQGRGGYNVPSLYGLALSGPYLHHGQAPTLEALLTDTRWSFHTQAGAANFEQNANPTDPDIVALKAYLLSIDATTAEIAVPGAGTPQSYDVCPAGP
jgi:hypothetical protein